jgi:DNA invertase Pin-like site-specific DNA recombinase
LTIAVILPILCLCDTAMNQLNTAKRCQIVAALVEGNSITETCRMLGVGKHTVLRVLEDAGCACAAYHDAMVWHYR